MKCDKTQILTKYYETEFDRLVKRVARRAGGWAQGEDVVQNAFLRALVYLDNYDPEKDFAGWFNGILFNELKKYTRIERDAGMSHEDEEISDTLEKTAFLGQVTEQIIHDINAMPEKPREIIRRFVFLGDTGKGIARDLKVNIHTIRKIVQNFYIDMRTRYAI